MAYLFSTEDALNNYNYTVTFYESKIFGKNSTTAPAPAPICKYKNRPGCRLCEVPITTPTDIDPHFHTQARDLSKKHTNEFAGNLQKNPENHTLEGTNLFKGKTYASVQMKDHGLVDWHTHPTKCLNKNECAVGLPSPMDLKNILISYIYKGVQGHLIYSRDGVYAIQISDSLANKLCRLKDSQITEFIDKQVYDHLEDVHAQFEKGTTLKNYSQYKSKFLEEARKLGFEITLRKNNDTPPQINIKT
jgi:hypothetical protein